MIKGTEVSERMKNEKEVKGYKSQKPEILREEEEGDPEGSREESICTLNGDPQPQERL